MPNLNTLKFLSPFRQIFKHLKMMNHFAFFHEYYILNNEVLEYLKNCINVTIPFVHYYSDQIKGQILSPLINVDFSFFSYKSTQAS